MKKRAYVVIAAIAVAAAPAFAILGLGDIVYDPSNFEEAVQELLQLEQSYAQLVQTYRMIQNQYQQMLFMAKEVPVVMSARYRAVRTPWTLAAPPDSFGSLAGWTNGINTGYAIASGYSTATQTLANYGAVFAQLPAEQTARIKADYATVELTDGANLAAMTTIGQIRGNANQVETTIQNLENDSLDSSPDMNTEIAVLNKINAAGVLALRNTQDTNKLLVALAEGQLVQAKRERDAEAAAFNEHIHFRAQAQAVMAAQAAGASDAMLAWRMP
jgi:hypothetical protein